MAGFFSSAKHRLQISTTIVLKHLKQQAPNTTMTYQGFLQGGRQQVGSNFGNFNPPGYGTGQYPGQLPRGFTQDSRAYPGQQNVGQQTISGGNFAPTGQQSGSFFGEPNLARGGGFPGFGVQGVQGNNGMLQQNHGGLYGTNGGVEGQRGQWAYPTYDPRYHYPPTEEQYPTYGGNN